MWNILQLMGGSKPRVWGCRFQGLLAREVNLWGVRLWRRAFRGHLPQRMRVIFCSVYFFLLCGVEL